MQFVLVEVHEERYKLSFAQTDLPGAVFVLPCVEVQHLPQD